MFKTDTYRLIKKTFNRFASLLVIVIIGVAFMMGLFSTPLIMRTSMDKYADEYNLQDIQIYSSYGFGENDLKALSKCDIIKNIYASKQLDAYCVTSKGTQLVTRLLETNPEINQYVITEGRAPKQENECLVLVSPMFNTLKLGNKLSFKLDPDEDITEQLSVTEYTIVGFCESPAYSINVMGPSNLNNMELEMVIYVPEENFISDYYTTILMTVEGASDYLSFTKKYQKYIDSQIDSLKMIASVQQEERKEELLADYRTEIEEGKALLEEEKTAGAERLAEAKAQLDAANEQITSGEEELNKYSGIIEIAFGSYDGVKSEILRRKADNEYKISELEKRCHYSFESAYTVIAGDYAEYRTNKNLMNMASDTLYTYEQEKAGIESSLESATAGSIEYIALEKRLETVNARIESIKSGQTEDSWELKQRNAEIDAYYISIGFDGVEDAATQIFAINAEIAAIEASEDFLSGVDSYVSDLQASYEDKLLQLAEGKIQYELGLKQYEAGLKAYNEGIEKAEIDIRKAEQALEELPSAEWMVLDRTSHYSSLMYKATCDQMAAICFSMPILFYLVAALVCMTTMTRLIDEQRGQIGTFVALGYSKRAIIGKYISYAILACAIGSVLGIVIGQQIFPTVIYETWKMMYIEPTMIHMYPIKFMLICIAAFVVLMVIVTYFVAKKTLDENAASLMRPKAPKDSKAIFLEKIGFIWNKLSFTSKVTARNLIRYKSRFFMTVIGIAGCTALLVVGWGVKDSVRDIVDIQYGDIFDYDYEIYLENDTNLESNLEILEDNGEIKTAAPYMTYISKVYFEDGTDATINVEVMDTADNSMIMNLKKSDRKTPLKLQNTGVIISQKFAKVHGIKAGDSITLESANGIKKQVVVKEICEMYVMHYAFISDVYYESVFDETIHYTNIAVKTDNGDRLKDDFERLQDVVSLENLEAGSSTFSSMIKALDLIILVIIITAGSLALVVLINLTQVNISERIREIATLKVLGFNDKEVNTYIFKEILILSLIGAIIGLPLGVVEHHFIMNIINMDMVMFGMNISLLSYTYAFLITITFTVLVLFFTRKPLKKVDMIESLKSVE